MIESKKTSHHVNGFPFTNNPKITM